MIYNDYMSDSIDKTNNIIRVPLYIYEYKEICSVTIHDAVEYLYYLEGRLPTEKELKEEKIKMTIDEIKKLIAESDENIPLYDPYTENVYLIERLNVYSRVVNHDYRPVDIILLEYLENVYENKKNKLEKEPELKNNKIFMRSIRKLELILEFIDSFDKMQLFLTFSHILFSHDFQLLNKSFTCMKKSFIPHQAHLKPFYTVDEAIKLGLNNNFVTIPKNSSYNDYKRDLENKEYVTLCNKIQKHDIIAKILIMHQKYITENDMIGLIQYYTLQGSYFMNQYLRGFTKYDYQNNYLEDNILKVWNLVANAPEFDKDYVLYRFVSKDDYLKQLKIGDIYQDNGFMSTTRDPFYRSDIYKFGFILMKIYIPKNIKGVGLSLELHSHFPAEEEIILAPKAKLKLIAVNNDVAYYHPDDIFAENIKTKYEFEWIGNDDMIINKRKPVTFETKTIDFLKIKKVDTYTIQEKINYLVKTQFDPMNRAKCTIGDKTFLIMAEWYDSTGPYKNMYAITSINGFCLYSIYEGYILFMIEIGEINNQQQIRVNYFTKYSRLNRQKIMGDENFIKFISTIAQYFDIPNVIIYADYMSCDTDMLDTYNNDIKSVTKVLSRAVKKVEETEKEKELTGYSKQISLTKTELNLQKYEQISNEDNMTKIYNDQKKRRQENTLPDDIVLDTTEYSGGSHCIDFYLYLKHNIKRYENTKLLNAELIPLFSYNSLDELRSFDPLTILEKTDRDEIYQVYVKTYVNEKTKEKHTIADFYIWIVENKCYLMDLFIKKIDRLKNYTNPFKKGIYILDALAYLYNRNYISSYNRFVKIEFNEEYQVLTLPKNDYRIIR